MSNILEQWYTLAKLRAELEKREKKKCFGHRGFGYLACNCRNQKEERKRTLIPYSKFEVLASRVMRYGIREEVKVKRQKIEEVQCFKYWEVRHFK